MLSIFFVECEKEDKQRKHELRHHSRDRLCFMLRRWVFMPGSARLSIAHLSLQQWREDLAYFTQDSTFVRCESSRRYEAVSLQVAPKGWLRCLGRCPRNSDAQRGGRIQGNRRHIQRFKLSTVLAMVSYPASTFERILGWAVNECNRPDGRAARTC
jgi:hypothetical protein